MHSVLSISKQEKKNHVSHIDYKTLKITLLKMLRTHWWGGGSEWKTYWHHYLPHITSKKIISSKTINILRSQIAQFSCVVVFIHCYQYKQTRKKKSCVIYWLWNTCGNSIENALTTLGGSDWNAYWSQYLLYITSK